MRTITSYFPKTTRPTGMLRVTALLVLLLTAFSGCGRTGSLNEGNCECVVSLAELPKEFSLLEEGIRDHFEVKVILKNITTEKLYHITLTEKDDFQKTIHLHPGIYQVYGAATNQNATTGITLKPENEHLELQENTPALVQIRIENPEEFTDHWMSVQPMPELLLAEKFDATVQINRRVFHLRAEDPSELYAQLDLSYDQDVPAYGKVELTDSQKGITLTLQNRTSSPVKWRECMPIGIYVTRNTVVFPKGVTLGMSPEAVCHETNGAYGTPDQFTGSLLLGWQLDNTYAVYNDPDTGDKLTIDVGTNNSQIRSIRYELALFED